MARPRLIERLNSLARELKVRYALDDHWQEGGSSGLSRLRQSKDPMKLELEGEDRTLIIAFGGMAGEFGMPFFEFLKATEGLPVKRLLVRDLRQAWYHRGIPGHGRSLMDVGHLLAQQLEGHEIDRLVMIGTSAGGYAALVFGTLLGADTVLAFAPQTVIDPAGLAAIDDHRWDDRVAGVTAARALDPRWADLGEVLPAAIERGERLLVRAGKEVVAPRFEVYFGKRDLLDRAHAERLAGVPGLTLHQMNGGHLVVRAMRNSGALDKLLRGALEGSVPSVDSSEESGTATAAPRG